MATSSPDPVAECPDQTHSNRLRNRSQSRQTPWRPVTGDHDLLHRIVQRVEGVVEELLLRPLFPRENWMSTNEQHIHIPELVRKLVILS